MGRLRVCLILTSALLSNLRLSKTELSHDWTSNLTGGREWEEEGKEERKEGEKRAERGKMRTLKCYT